ncbi:unnamed protein product [Rodentolepis nana]|uniref:Uncharacterized protein n=1 Tax=Rodentolepis nana TaxID=102285 RepID=A0A3P7T2D9_RODNA|nr:unnamed protein product [Rodentolepis nana]
MGGSLCSLTSRGYDGVAHSLAEAMQDDESLARSAQQQLFLGSQQQQQQHFATITPIPLTFNRSNSPAIGSTVSSKVLSGKRDSLFLCESDFPEMESSAPVAISETIEAPTLISNLPFPMDELEIHEIATTEVATPILGAVTVAEPANMNVATSLPFRMDFLGGSLFSEESLSSSPSKPGASSLGGGSSLQMSTSKKTKKARKRASAKRRQLQELQQKEPPETEESPGVSSTNVDMSTSIASTTTRWHRRSSSSKKAEDEEKEVSESPLKKLQGKQQKSSKRSSPSGLSLSRSISDEDYDDNNGGWAAEIERDSPY